MIDLEKEREMFEAWVKKECPQIQWELNNKSDNSDYDSGSLSWAWSAWEYQQHEIESLKAQLAQYQSDDYVSVKKSVIKQLIIELDHIFSAHELLGLTDLIALRDGFSLLVDDEAQEQHNAKP